MFDGSIGYLIVRPFGKETRQQPPATLVGASVSLRTRRTDQGRPSHVAKAREDGHNPSDGGNSRCARAFSSSKLDSHEFGAVLPVDRYGEPDDYPALYVQVSLNLNIFESKLECHRTGKNIVLAAIGPTRTSSKWNLGGSGGQNIHTLATNVWVHSMAVVML